MRAPPIQIVYFGQEYTVQCSTTLARMTVLLKLSSANEVISKELGQISFADEGLYECIIRDPLENFSIFKRTIRLVVLSKYTWHIIGTFLFNSGKLKAANVIKFRFFYYYS